MFASFVRSNKHTMWTTNSTTKYI